MDSTGNKKAAWHVATGGFGHEKKSSRKFGMENIRDPGVPDHDLSAEAQCFVSNSKGRGGAGCSFSHFLLRGEDLFCFLRLWKYEFLEDGKLEGHVGFDPNPH